MALVPSGSCGKGEKHEPALDNWFPIEDGLSSFFKATHSLTCTHKHTHTLSAILIMIFSFLAIVLFDISSHNKAHYWGTQLSVFTVSLCRNLSSKINSNANFELLIT